MVSPSILWKEVENIAMKLLKRRERKGKDNRKKKYIFYLLNIGIYIFKKYQECMGIFIFVVFL